MTILLTGWTGNVGGLLLPLLRARFPDAALIGLSRQETDQTRRAAQSLGLQTARADLHDADAVEAAFAAHAPIEAVVHIAHIHYSPLIARLAHQYQTRRLLLVHTTGMYSRFREYGDRYREIDDAIQQETPPDLHWTIVRPTMIYGSDRDRNMHKLIKTLARTPVFPLFGETARIQPVHGGDVANALLHCWDNPRTFHRAYDLSGGTAATYGEVVRLVCKLLGRRPLLMPVPTSAVLATVSAVERLHVPFPLSREQILRLSENKAYAHDDAARDFGYAPRSLETGLGEEIALLRGKGIIR